jgi:hypothetical protein
MYITSMPGAGSGAKNQRPRSVSAGPPVVCLELAEGAKALCESKLR